MYFEDEGVMDAILAGQSGEERRVASRRLLVASEQALKHAVAAAVSDSLEKSGLDDGAVDEIAIRMQDGEVAGTATVSSDALPATMPVEWRASKKEGEWAVAVSKASFTAIEKAAGVGVFEYNDAGTIYRVKGLQSADAAFKIARHMLPDGGPGEVQRMADNIMGTGRLVGSGPRGGTSTMHTDEETDDESGEPVPSTVVEVTSATVVVPQGNPAGPMPLGDVGRIGITDQEIDSNIEKNEQVGQEFQISEAIQRHLNGLGIEEHVANIVLSSRKGKKVAGYCTLEGPYVGKFAVEAEFGSDNTLAKLDAEVDGLKAMAGIKTYAVSLGEEVGEEEVEAKTGVQAVVKALQSALETYGSVMYNGVWVTPHNIVLTAEQMVEDGVVKEKAGATPLPTEASASPWSVVVRDGQKVLVRSNKAPDEEKPKLEGERDFEKVMFRGDEVGGA